MKRWTSQSGRTLLAAWLLAAAAPAFLCGGCRDCTGPNPSWATSVEYPHLPQMQRVHAGLYGGPRLDDGELDRLRELGFRTVVSLQRSHDDRRRVQRHGLRYIRIPVKVWDPEVEHVAEAIDAVSDPDHQPVYLHCNLGIDRTGLVIAAYRVVVEGWTRQQAICEMTRPESGFWLWRNLIGFIEEMDVDRMRQRTGNAPPFSP